MKRFVNKKTIYGLCMMTLLQTTVTASNIGLSTHMAHTHTNNTQTGTMRLVDEMETDWIRDELRWGWGMEATMKGELRMPTADWIDTVYNSGVNSLVTLGLGNTLYNDINGIDDTVGIYVPTKENTDYFNAFINYVKFVAENCKGKVKAYEIWNEPNHKDSNYQISKSKYSYDAADYFELLKAAHDAIEKIDPDAKIVGGAFLLGGTVDSGWMETLFSSGAGAYMDAFSVHIYTYKRSDQIESSLRSSLDRVEKVMDRYNYNGELWLTETGYYTGTADYSVNEDEQASLLVRSKVVWDNYLKESGRNGEYFCYTLRDNGQDLSKGGHNFGLVDYGYKKKPAFYAGRTFNKLMSDKELTSFDTAGDTVLAEYMSDNAKVNTAYVGYSTGGKVQKAIPIEGHITYIYNRDGELLKTVTGADAYTATLTDSPIFIHSVDIETEITSLTYNSDNNICTIKGTAKNLPNVTIELINTDGEVVQTETAVTDGEGSFSDSFSVNSDGAYTVRVGKPELDEFGSTYFAQQNIEMVRYRDSVKDISINYTTKLNGDTLNVKLTGTSGLNKGETVNIMVMPEDLVSPDISKVAYIGDVETDGAGSFELEFDIPKKKSHIYNYKLLVRGNKTDISENGVNHYLETDGIVTYDFTLNLSDGRFVASAVIADDTDEKQEAVIIIAQYNNSGELIKISSEKLTVGSEKNTVSLGVEKDSSATLCKSFIIKDFGAMKPLAPKLEVN